MKEQNNILTKAFIYSIKFFQARGRFNYNKMNATYYGEKKILNYWKLASIILIFCICLEIPFVIASYKENNYYNFGGEINIKKSNLNLIASNIIWGV